LDFVFLVCETRQQVPEQLWQQYVKLICPKCIANSGTNVWFELLTKLTLITYLTLIACCMKSIAISMPNSSPAIRVNLLIIEQAPKMASKNSNTAVQTHTLQNQVKGKIKDNVKPRYDEWY